MDTSALVFRRLTPNDATDRSEWAAVFRGAPSFVHATEGRRPTDEDAHRMLATVPKGRSQEDVFLNAISHHGVLCGCAYVARHHPADSEATLVLLVLMETHQRGNLGVRCVRRIEAEARTWGCTKLAGVVDAANERALRFWQRLGFQEQRRQRLPGLVGEAVVGFIALDQDGMGDQTAARRLRRTRTAHLP